MDVRKQAMVDSKEPSYFRKEIGAQGGLEVVADIGRIIRHFACRQSQCKVVSQVEDLFRC